MHSNICEHWHRFQSNPSRRRLDSANAAETNVRVCFDLQHNGDYDEWFVNASTWRRGDRSPERQGTRSSASDASAKQALPFNTDYVDVSLIAAAAAVKTPRSIYCYSADSFPITAPNLTDLFPIVRSFMRAALITGEYCYFLNWTAVKLNVFFLQQKMDYCNGAWVVMRFQAVFLCAPIPPADDWIGWSYRERSDMGFNSSP